MKSLPAWFKQEIPEPLALSKAKFISGFNVRTVCREAKCPNAGHCFKQNKMTFIILGGVCTRNCRFCAVDKITDNKKLPLDIDEPRRIAEAVRALNTGYVVITSVTRDDLPDGGASVFAESVKLVRKINKDIKIELLIPDFKGSPVSLGIVLDASADVVAHNIETVKRLYGSLRPMADYRTSLEVIKFTKGNKPDIITKSSLMLGLGETGEEVIEAMKDLRYNKCDVLTLGQYLAPSLEHYPVKEFIDIKEFREYKRIGLGLGFLNVLSGPLVRSSYKAEEVFKEIAYA